MELLDFVIFPTGLFPSFVLTLCARFGRPGGMEKVDTISTKFRTFPMEIVAGEPNTEVPWSGETNAFDFGFCREHRDFGGGEAQTKDEPQRGR